MLRILAAAVFSITSSAALAGEVTYSCKYKEHGTHGWIPPEAIYVVDAEKGSVIAYDGLIHESVGKPIPVEATLDDAGKYVLKWQLKNLGAKNGSGITANYRVFLDVKRNKAHMKMILPAYANRDRGTAKCVVKS